MWELLINEIHNASMGMSELTPSELSQAEAPRPGVVHPDFQAPAFPKSLLVSNKQLKNLIKTWRSS